MHEKQGIKYICYHVYIFVIVFRYSFIHCCVTKLINCQLAPIWKFQASTWGWSTAQPQEWTRKNCFQNATAWRNDIHNATDDLLFSKTLRNRIHDSGINARRHFIRRQQPHVRDRLEWAYDHVRWPLQGWTQALFSDEYRLYSWTLLVQPGFSYDMGGNERLGEDADSQHWERHVCGRKVRKWSSWSLYPLISSHYWSEFIFIEHARTWPRVANENHAIYYPPPDTHTDRTLSVEFILHGTYS